MSTSKRIRIVTILGSRREGNMTGKALALVNDELGGMDGVEVVSIDPAELTLVPPGPNQSTEAQKKLQEAVSSATGVVLATPEYHGSYSSVMKLIIEHLGFPSTLSGKPVALLGVAAGAIGAIKALEHLRSVCSHVGAMVLPGPVSLAGVRKIFDDEGNCLDPKAEERVRSVARNLVDYIEQTVCPRIALEQMVRSESSDS